MCVLFEAGLCALERNFKAALKVDVAPLRCKCKKTTVKIEEEEENTVRNFDCSIESAGLKFYSQNAGEEKGKELERERGERRSRRRIS